MTKIVALGDIANVFNGKTPSKADQRTFGYPVLKIRDVSESGAFRGKFGSYVDSQFAEKHRSKKIQLDDSLILNAAHNADYVASKQYRAHEAVVGAIATGEWLIARADGISLDQGYLHHWLSSPTARFNIRLMVKGIHLYPKDMQRMKVPLPPLKEQKRIAAILDKADAIRRKRQQAIELADQFLRSVFLDMFGDPVTNPMGWESLKFGDVGKLDRGKSKHRPRNDPALLGGKYPLIQTGDVANSRGYITRFTSTYSDMGLAQSRLWPVGTLCITIAANIAKTGVLQFEACFPDSVVGFTPGSLVTVQFVQHWLGFLQKILEDNAPESAQKNINLEILRNLYIPTPPIELQERFSEVVDLVKTKQDKYLVSHNQLNALFESIVHRVFAGELSKAA